MKQQDFETMWKRVCTAELNKYNGKSGDAAKAMQISEANYSSRKTRLKEGRITPKLIMEFEEFYNIELLVAPE